MRYFFGFLVTLLLLFAVVFLLFRDGGDEAPQPTPRSLNSYAATNAEAQMTIDGPINSNEEHTQVRITVDRNNVTYEQLRGYDGNVVRMDRFDNTESSYYAFLSSLSNAGFTHGDKNKALSNASGYCPLQNRYIFALKQDNRDIQRYWTTDCDGTKTYLGAQNLTIELFQAQVPGYADLTADLEI